MTRCNLAADLRGGGVFALVVDPKEMRFIATRSGWPSYSDNVCVCCVATGEYVVWMKAVWIRCSLFVFGCYLPEAVLRLRVAGREKWKKVEVVSLFFLCSPCVSSHFVRTC